MQEKLKGIFPSLPTPFFEGGEIDFESLKNVVDFAVEKGVQGLTVCDYGSEFVKFTDDERRAVVETVLSHTAGRVPVIVGVSAMSPMLAVQWAVHAQEHGAAAVLFGLPYLSGYAWDEVVELGLKPMDAALHIPIMLLDAPERGVGIGVGQQMQVIGLLKNVRYVKTETATLQAAITSILDAAKKLPSGSFDGVSTGENGYDMIHDYRRGARLFSPGVHLCDLSVALWNALEAGDEARAKELQYAVSPVYLIERLYPLDMEKSILRRRGVIAHTTLRSTGRPQFDERNERDLDRTLASLKKKLAHTGKGA
ncbi:dihydrodipicolinate synthase family protein [Feifania hominis]|uniref:Dihydrodipicolinate synthase family protein n=1 Tax=Feifania hominis TaxID=2763660 RepID=A0A926DD19_9FIRM|nr:dihydrodipicolinate synthase family protein [Feifania hominis]MBC8536363.1 dihydrodipicolinate synthase family protein [Feifania hominis]